jgi:hypothetical protein
MCVLQSTVKKIRNVFGEGTVLLFHVLRDDGNMGFYNFISISQDCSEVLMDHDSIYFDCQDS